MSSKNLRQIPFAPADLCFLGANAATVQFLLQYNGLIDSATFQEALAKASEVFWPLKSRIQLADGHATFVEHDQPITFKVDSLSYEPEVSIPEHAALLTDDIASLPNEDLVKIRLTLTPSKSYLSVSISHTLVDGYSYFYFLNYLSQVFRNEIVLPHPSHDRGQWLNWMSQDVAKQDPVNVMEDSFLSQTGFVLGPERPVESSKQITWETSLFDRKSLDKVIEDSKSKEEQTRLTENDLIVANLWRYYSTLWNPSESQSLVTLPMDGRRFFKGKATSYFGNLIRGVTVTMNTFDLSQSPVNLIANKIREAVSKIDVEDFRRSFLAINQLWNTSGLKGVSKIQVADQNCGLLVTNLSRLDVRGLDFGCGAPVLIYTPAPARRIATILPGPTGYRVQVSLPK